MVAYHGIVVKESLKDELTLKKFKIIGNKQSRNFFLIKIEIPENKVNKTINFIQKNLKGKKYYAHLYRDEELIVVFPQKIFFVSPDKETWKEVIRYGISLDIPREQLDFKPCRFEDETY